MINFEVYNNPSIKCNLTPEQWELYTKAFTREEMNRVADELNGALQSGVNNGGSKDQIRVLMDLVMAANAKYGAQDTEPRNVLEDLLSKIFK